MAFGLPAPGTRRLRIMFAVAAPASLLIGFALILAVYGRPYWPGWWLVMMALVLASIPGAIIAAAAVEWVIAGYRPDRPLRETEAKPS